MNQRKFDVLVVGELNVDIILNKLNKTPQVGQEQRAGEMTLTMGSSTAIFAANTSKLGSSVAFLGKVGDDAYGNFMKEALSSYHVNTDSIIVDPSLKTGATIIYVLEKDRMMVTYPGAMEHLTVEDVSDEALRSARHIHTSTIFFQPGLKKGLTSLFRRAKRYGLSISMDTQWDPEEKWDLDLDNLLPNLDFFLPNEAELLHLTGTSDAESALDSLSRHHDTCIVVKQGARGATLQHQGKRIFADALPVPRVADTVGAGDSFNAGFVHAFLSGKDLETCLREGARTAAVSVTAAGGVEAIVDYQQVMEKAAEMEHQ